MTYHGTAMINDKDRAVALNAFSGRTPIVCIDGCAFVAPTYIQAKLFAAAINRVISRIENENVSKNADWMSGAIFAHDNSECVLNWLTCHCRIGKSMREFIKR